MKRLNPNPPQQNPYSPPAGFTGVFVTLETNSIWEDVQAPYRLSSVQDTECLLTLCQAAQCLPPLKLSVPNSPKILHDY